MKCNLPILWLFMVSISFFCLSTTASASSEQSAPVVNAWIEGESLEVMADDDEGVDVIVVNDESIHYTVNGSIRLALKDYAGTNEMISVYAVDFAGNKSDTLRIANPLYQKPEPIKTANVSSTAQSKASKTMSNKTSKASSTMQQVQASVALSPSPAPTPSMEIIPNIESAMSISSPSVSPASLNPLTVPGSGEVLDNADGSTDGKEFFTITTANENTFYLVIDRQRGTQNVYFLSPVNENDLLSLAEKSETTDAVATSDTIPTPEPLPEQSAEPETEPATKKGGSSGMIVLLVVALGVGGGAYYFKVLKPRQTQSLTNSDFQDDEDGYDDETDDETQYVEENPFYLDDDVEERYENDEVYEYDE